MATMTNQTTERKGSCKPERRCRLVQVENGELVLTITIVTRGPKIGQRIESTHYRLRPVECDFGQGFELLKLVAGHEPPYHVHLDSTGNTCDCRGHIRWGTECKHIAAVKTLLEAGRLSVVPPATAKAS